MVKIGSSLTEIANVRVLAACAVLLIILSACAQAMVGGQTSQPLPPSLLWSADHETGDVTQWEIGDGGGVFNTGTGRAAPTTEVAHSGQYALALQIDDANGTHQAARLFRWTEAQSRDSAYYSVWYYFPQRYTVPTWWNVFQWKSRRVPADPNTNDPTWIVGVENRTSGAMHFVLEYWPEQRSRGQTVKDIPVGRWTHLEAFIRRATDDTGEVTVWQDGVLLFDVKNVKTANSTDFSWSVNNYANQLVPAEATIFVDDAAISTRRLKSDHPNGDPHTQTFLPMLTNSFMKRADAVSPQRLGFWKVRK